jgi:hypothetical protein
MDEIHEISALIDHTLGIFATPSPSSTRPTPPPQSSSRAVSAPPPPPSPPPAPIGSIYSPTKLTDMLCIKVLQLHSLSSETPKGASLYLSFDWGTLGKASTQALPQTKSLHFNATLRYRSPLPHGSSLQDALMISPPLLIQLYSRHHESPLPRSDHCLGSKLIDDVSRIDLRTSQRVQIKLWSDGKKALVGIAEIEIVIM